MKTSKVITQSIDSLENYSKIVFGVLLVTLILVVAGRIFLIVAVTMNGSIQKSIKTNIERVSLEIQDLEHQYISAKANITEEFAKNSGFVNPVKTNYITATQASVNLTLNIK